MRIASIVGARPNFIKLAPIHEQISKFTEHVIIHTGQHYDFAMSEIFFKEFNLPKPDYNLDVGSGLPTHQISKIIERVGDALHKHNFDLVLVYGDTNSTLGGALAAAKLGLKVAHIEAGLRSFDIQMPEEYNRILVDFSSHYLFAPTTTALDNLCREGVWGKVILSGDVGVEMIHRASCLKSTVLSYFNLNPKSYVLVTMHRSENMNRNNIETLLDVFERLHDILFVFPIHPHTYNTMKEVGILSRLVKCTNVKTIQPVGYTDFIHLLNNSNKLLTDSGGAQKEAFVLSVPCVTMRKNTEWIETVNQGFNVLVDMDANSIVSAISSHQEMHTKTDVFGSDAAQKISRFIQSLS